MESVLVEESEVGLRPSRLIAEALVHRHGSAEVKERAEEMGLCENLTRAVIGACCRDQKIEAAAVVNRAP